MTDEERNETRVDVVVTDPAALREEVDALARLLHLLVVPPVRRGPNEKDDPSLPRAPDPPEIV